MTFRQVCCIGVMVCAVAVFPGSGEVLPPGEIEHFREELGINSFTAPSIEQIFQQLATLHPLPLDKVFRPLPENSPQDRARLSLITGTVLADGFLAVASQRQARIEPVGRALLRYSKGLGVGDRVTRQSRSLLELAAREKWDDMKTELVRAQAEVEGALVALKDEEIAHLIALGGWLRALEIASTAVADVYTPERAAVLSQTELIDYFIDRVGTLHPERRRTPLFQSIQRYLSEVRSLTAKGPLSPGDVARVRNLSRDLNTQIAE